MTAGLVLFFAMAWIGPGHVEDLPTPMDPNALYSALNTIAQCAAALAALIGFLGLWQLDWLRREQEQVKQHLQQLLSPTFTTGEKAQMDDPTFLVEAAEQLLAGQRKSYGEGLGFTLGTEDIQPMVRSALARWNALPIEQQRLMRVLSVFLVVTLACILPAIVGIVHAEWLKTWPWTPWLLYMAGAWLTGAPAYVVWQAARPIRTLTILALLAMAAPALAGSPGRCTSYYETAMNRWQTLCADGTRATSTYSSALRQWQTTVTPPAGKTCDGRRHPKTHQWAGRCP